jgi:hypothetical protein
MARCKHPHEPSVTNRYMGSILSGLRLPGWLAGAYSARPRAEHHVSGSLSIGWGVTLVQHMAMTIVIGIKLVFEYYALCLPMVKPVSVWRAATPV